MVLVVCTGTRILCFQRESLAALRLPLRAMAFGTATKPEGDGDGHPDKAILEERKRRIIQTYLEEHLGGGNPDRVTLALLLQRHGVVVRGGQPEALSLMEALMAWKRDEWRPPVLPDEEVQTGTPAN